MRALDVAAPSSVIDPLSPWAEPVTSSDRVMAAGFWVSFHGLSAFAHAVAVGLFLFFTLLPIPFLAATCATVKPVDKAPERVVLSVVEAPKPPPPAPRELALASASAPGDGVALRVCAVDADCGARERCVDGVCVARTKSDHRRPKRKAHARRKRHEAGVLALLTADQGQMASLFGTDDGNVLGALVGDSVGDAYGVGGLGVRGVEGGGGDGVEGGVVGGVEGGVGGGVEGGAVGGVAGGVVGGTLVSGPRWTLTVDGVPEGARRRAARAAESCGVEDIAGVLHARGGAVVSVRTSPRRPCVEARLRRALHGLPDGDTPFALVPRPSAVSPSRP